MSSEYNPYNPSGPPAPLRPAERLHPDVFQLPADRMSEGYYSDKYFVRTRDLLVAEGGPSVTMQVFQKHDAWVAGTDEAVAILKRCLTDGFTYADLEVRALRDGDRVRPWEPVLEITGPYAAFAHLETLFVGVLARRTRVASNTRAVVEAAWPKPVMFFPARHDHWMVQTGDGWAAHIAGAIGVSTDAQASWWGSEGIGTVPHALIAAYGGDTVAAARALDRHVPEDVDIIALVDFHNDCVRTSLEVANALGSRLYAVRLDTASEVVDASLVAEMGDFDPRGVNAHLVRHVRRALDAAGHENVRIVCSGGFDAARIRAFEEARVPVDAYGVGSALLGGSYDYTADVVRVEGAPVAKVGRRYRDNPRLEIVE